MVQVNWNRRVWRLAGPIMLSNVSVPLLGAVDTAVVGHLPGAHNIGAVAVGALIFSIIYWGFGFLRMGTTGFTAQAHFSAFPEPHRAKLRTTHGLERLHAEIKRRIPSAAAFPNRTSALRLITTVALRTTEAWSQRRYLDLSLLEPKEIASAA